MQRSLCSRRFGLLLALLLAPSLAGCGRAPAPVSRGPQAPLPADPIASPVPTAPTGGFASGTNTPVTLASTDSSGPSAPTTANAGGPGGRSAFEQEVDRWMLAAINRERTKRGLGQVQMEPRLMVAAWAHAYDMFRRNYTDHQSPEGKWSWHRATEAGFPASPGNNNENLCQVFFRKTPKEIAETAMWEYSQSDGHWKNLLDPRWKLVGLATVYRPDVAPKDSYGEPQIPNVQTFAF